MADLGWMLIAFVSSLGLAGLFRRYALRRGIIDKPNMRSSHTEPTPRGGGVAIAATFLLGLTASFWFEQIDGALYWALLGAGALAAIVGFVDDHRHVAARWRLIAHFLAAAWVVYWLIPDEVLLIKVIAVVALVWMLNLYNFMDGIDGLAGIEAITVAFGFFVLSFYGNADSITSHAYLVLVGAGGGFLYWNFPKARMFLGDSGSGFLGIIFGALILDWFDKSIEMFCASLILAGCFIVDATLTLLRRLLRRRRVYEAHRGHAYQVAARQLGDHRPVALVVGGVNTLWLLPMALLVVGEFLPPHFALLLAWTPLLGLAIYFDAGATDG